MKAKFANIVRPKFANPVDFSSATPKAVLPLPQSESSSRPPVAAAKLTHISGPQGFPREHAYRLCSVLLIGDWAAAFLAIFCGLQFREWQRTGLTPWFDNPFGIRSSVLIWSVGASTLFMWLMVVMKTYEVANLYKSQRWLKNLVRSMLLCSIAIWAYIGLFQITEFTPRVGVVYCMVTLTAFVTFWRLISFMFLIQPRVREAASSRVIVVGWNEKVAHLRTAMRRDLAQLGEIIGCVPMPGGHFAARPPTELAVLGDYSALPRLIRECRAHSIILSDVSCSAREIQHLIGFCQRELLGFQLVPEYFPALGSGLQVQTLSGVPLLGMGQLALDRMLNRAIKRTMDIVGAVVGLAFCAAIVPLFAVLIYLESPGPLLYKQRRTSRSGRTFVIYKLRSMRVDAESSSGAVWCKKEDSRRLKIGTLMRKYNIDELPQFWNVLKGDMSLVGPRPERPELIERFKEEIPNYNARHEVRSGLTGWAQINGLRGDTDLGKRIEADLYYLENWSLLLDFYCIFATFVRNKNAC